MNTLIKMSRFGVHTVFLALVAIQIADALMCYQCADASIDDPCSQDHEGLVNTTMGRRDTYKKNCTHSNPRWDRCVIESHRSVRGEYTLYRRDCHDGETFNKDVEDDEFHNLTANNYTTCTVNNNKLICFTFCRTDYCNGPIREEPDPCEDWDPYGNDTLPEGAVCGGNRIHDDHITRFLQITALAVVWMFMKASKVQI